jgi:hypothetical protein
MTAMNIRTFPSQFSRDASARGQLSSRIRQRFARIAAWMAICAEYHAAAANYEELSRLSDAELSRRGLARDTLARDLCESADRSANP